MIDVIVPVYAGEDETRACLASLLAARCEVPFELLVLEIVPARTETPRSSAKLT